MIRHTERNSEVVVGKPTDTGSKVWAVSPLGILCNLFGNSMVRDMGVLVVNALRAKER